MASYIDGRGTLARSWWFVHTRLTGIVDTIVFCCSFESSRPVPGHSITPGPLFHFPIVFLERSCETTLSPHTGKNIGQQSRIKGDFSKPSDVVSWGVSAVTYVVDMPQLITSARVGVKVIKVGKSETVTAAAAAFALPLQRSLPLLTHLVAVSGCK